MCGIKFHAAALATGASVPYWQKKILTKLLTLS